jgi:hypothetical protein
MYPSRHSKDPLSQKVRAAMQAKQVDTSNIPTFFTPPPDHSQEIAQECGRWNYFYPFLLHQDASAIQIHTADEQRLGQRPLSWVLRSAQHSEPQARLTSALPVATDSPALRVSRGLDFLKVSLWIKWDAIYFGQFLGMLDQAKKKVQDTELDCIPIFEESGFDWNLSRSGTRLYTFRMTSGDITLLFNRRPHQQKIPNCRLEIGSLSCWSPGFYAIYNRIKTFLSLYGGDIHKEQVSEVHLTADFVGCDIKTVALDNREHWIALARDDGDFDGLKVHKKDIEPEPEELEFNRRYTNRKFSGLNIGCGDLMLRVYDKVLELKRTRATHKQQIFSEIWGVKTYDERPVTRVEYQIRRPKLRDFCNEEGERINTVFDLVNCLKSLWRYLTTEWTRHTSNPVDRNHHQSRAKISEFWEKVQAVVWTGVFGYVRSHPVKHKDIDMLRKQARGILMSVCASLEVEPDDIDKIVYLCKEMIEEDLHRFFEDEEAFVTKMTTKRNEFRATLAG